MSADSLRVFLKDITVNLPVGIYPAEQGKPQSVTIDAEIMVNPAHHFTQLNSTDLSKSFNYDRLYQFLHNDLMQLGHIALLESLAEHICHFCLGDKIVKSVTVSVTKNNIYPGAARAGISLTRSRKDSL